MFLMDRDNQFLPGESLGSCVAGCDQVIQESSQVRVMSLCFSSEAKIPKRNSKEHPSPSEADVLTCGLQNLSLQTQLELLYLIPKLGRLASWASCLYTSSVPSLCLLPSQTPVGLRG